MLFFYPLPGRDGACPMTVASRLSVRSLLTSSAQMTMSLSLLDCRDHTGLVWHRLCVSVSLRALSASASTGLALQQR